MPLLTSAVAMAVSLDGHRVRERTRAHGTYLHADDQRASLHLCLPSANAARESASPPPLLYLCAFHPGPDKAEAGTVTRKIVRAGMGC